MDGPWPVARLEDVAPLVRRPVEIAPDEEYPELGVRSFGRGIFHKGVLRGAALTWQKLFRVEAGDLVFSNIKAWEGAFAVAGPEDHARVGSHRYLTCVPKQGVCDGLFLWYYLQTPEGLEQVQAASPGSADRNRTLSQERLAAIKVPVPPIAQQRQLVARIQQTAQLIKEVQRLLAEVEQETAALRATMERKIWPPEAVNRGVPLADITTFLARGRQSTQGESDHYLIKSQHVQMGHYRPTELTLAPHAAAAVKPEALVRRDDILIACSAAGCLGRVAFYDGPDITASTDTHVAIARADSDRVLPAYLFAYLRSAVGQEQLRSREQGALGRERTGFRLAELNLRDLRQVPVPVPAISRQEELLNELRERFQRLDEVAMERQAARADLEVLLCAVLRRAFTISAGAARAVGGDRTAA